MLNNRRKLETGILIGAALGAIYVATRPRTTNHDSSRLVNWSKVEQMAISMVQSLPDSEVTDRHRLGFMYNDMVQQSVAFIRSYTGLDLINGTGTVYVFDRVEWIRANIEGFRKLFSKIEEIQAHLDNSSSLGSLVFSQVNKQLMSTHMGVLLGYLSRRVLGQYDLSLLGKEPVGGSLYFVEPNIRKLERDLRLPGYNLRLWIALHETTHAFEFEANPWLRDYFNSLLESYFDVVNSQVKTFRGKDLLNTAISSLRSRDNYEGWMEIFMPPAQREVFRKLQAVMSLLEGYSNHIMNSIGSSVLPDYSYIKSRFDARQANTSWADKLFARLTGLHIKMEQYRQGEAFVNKVVTERGINFMNKVWEGPENLPSLEEIKSPQLWIERIDAYA